MHHQEPERREDEFTGLPPRPPSDSHQIQEIAPRKPMTAARKPRRWIVLTAIPGLLAIGAWELGMFGEGEGFWLLGVAIGVLMLIVVLFVGLSGKQPGDLELRHFQGYGYLLLCVGAWTGVGYFFPVFIFSTDKEPNVPLRITSGVVWSERVPQEKESVRFRAPLGSNTFKIETLTPRGWVRRAVERDSENFGHRFISLKEIKTCRAYIDNRGQPEVHLGCGQLSFHIKANGKESIRLPAPTEAERYPLTLDGKEIGTLGGKNVLIDTLGTRSYQFRTLRYGHSLAGLLGGKDPIPDPDPLLQGRVRELPRDIDYFLEPAPEKIKIVTFKGIDFSDRTRTELIDLAN